MMGAPILGANRQSNRFRELPPEAISAEKWGKIVEG